MAFIILDRDGVINFDSDFYIKSPDEWLPIPGSLEAIATLTRLGYRVIIATNQSGIARKLYDAAMLEKIHAKLLAEVKKAGGEIEAIFFCPHHPDEKCICRKPQPGMFHQIQQKYGMRLAETYFVGDSFSDMQAALNAGCKPILVMTGNGEKTLANNPDMQNIRRYADLAEAVEKIFQCKVTYAN
jgi:D-glycero-D-manno-heptose 1,7-bisphosphate phosphatase